MFIQTSFLKIYLNIDFYCVGYINTFVALSLYLAQGRFAEIQSINKR